MPLDFDVMLHHRPGERGETLTLVAARGLPPHVRAELRTLGLSEQLCGHSSTTCSMSGLSATASSP
jgi:hypothetical protein